MLLRRVEVDQDATFYLLNDSIDAFRRLARIDGETHRNKVITHMLEAVRLAATNGWFYVNPRNEDQLIAYCDIYRKPFWFVVAYGDREGFKHIEKDYAVVTVLGHRDRKFQAAIEEHRALAEPEGSS